MTPLMLRIKLAQNELRRERNQLAQARRAKQAPTFTGPRCTTIATHHITAGRCTWCAKTATTILLQEDSR